MTKRILLLTLFVLVASYQSTHFFVLGQSPRHVTRKPGSRAGARIITTWKRIDAANNEYYFYDQATITRTTNGTVKLWVKIIPFFEGDLLAETNSTNNPSNNSSNDPFSFEEFLRESRVSYIDQKISKRRDAGLSTAGYEDYSYHMTLYEIKCRPRVMRVLSWVDYSRGGSVLDSNDEVSVWANVPPDSIGEGILEVGCRP